MLRHDFPYQFQIDSKVLVDDHVPETDYLWPWDFRVLARPPGLNASVFRIGLTLAAP
jgi:hypothetical protein